MYNRYVKSDYFDDEVVYKDEDAQAIYLEIITKGKEYFLEEPISTLHRDYIVELFEKLRQYRFEETYRYSMFSSIEVKIKMFEENISQKLSNFSDISLSRPNEYKKLLLQSLRIMHSMELYRFSFSKISLANIQPKFQFFIFLKTFYYDEMYQSFISEVDYFINKLNENGLNVMIDFDNGLLNTNGLKYSFLNNSNLELVLRFKNPYPRIFKNKTCFDFFTWLKENLIVDTYSDYSFIYYKMIEYSFMYENITHKEYINFLSSFYDITINHTKLKTTSRDNFNKTQKFKQGLDEIKPNTLIF